MEKPGIVKLIFLACFPAISAVLITPALPAIDAILAGGENKVQDLVSIYLVGYMLGQLPYGPLGHRFGLKKIILVTTVLSFFAILLTFVALALDHHFFAVLGRLLLALFASSALKVAVAYIGKCYPKNQTSKMMALLSVSFAIGPSLAVFLAGYAVEAFNWSGAFYLQLIYTLLIFFLFCRLPNDPVDADVKLSLSSIFSQFKTHFGIKEIVFCGIMGGMSPALMYAYASTAPFQAITMLGISAGSYGAYTILLYVGMLLGGLIGMWINATTDPMKNVRLFVYLSLVVSVVYFVLTLIVDYTIWMIVLPSALLIIAYSMVQSNATSIALSHAKNQSYGASTFTFLVMFVCFVTVQILSYLSSSSVLILSTTYLILSILGLICYWPVAHTTPEVE